MTYQTHAAQRLSNERREVARPFVERLIEAVAPCPWPTTAGAWRPRPQSAAQRRAPLYTPEQRLRRDASPWTTVQAVLAPLQFLVFAVSVFFVLRTLTTGEGAVVANASVLLKTAVLYTIMITGAVWEKQVFGKYLFAEAFFWEDVFSMLVLALHTAYICALLFSWGDTQGQMWLALGAYAAYVINAAQFIWKLRLARLDARPASQTSVSSAFGATSTGAR